MPKLKITIRPLPRPNKRQTVFPFTIQRVPLALDQYTLDAVAALDDYEIAKNTRRDYEEHGALGPHVAGGFLSTIKYVRSQTLIGLYEAKMYVEACMRAYPEESQ